MQIKNTHEQFLCFVSYGKVFVSLSITKAYANKEKIHINTHCCAIMCRCRIVRLGF